MPGSEPERLGVYRGFRRAGSGFIAAHLRGELDLGYWFSVTRARRIVLLGRGLQISFARRSDPFNLTGPGPAGWLHAPSIYFSWRDSAGNAGTFNIRALSKTSIREMGVKTRFLMS